MPVADFNKGQSTCCSCLCRRKANAFDQTLVILRHGEKKDDVDPSWKGTDEGNKWPFDAPLTESGNQKASEVAKEILDLHKKAKFMAIATSPYRHCLETAAPLAKLLRLPIIVDQELGQVWDSKMPEKPMPFMKGAELRSFIKSLGIKDANPTERDGKGLRLFGKLGQYPETDGIAKTRYVVRLATYIEESLDAQKNYVLVTHAGGVAAALQMLDNASVDVKQLESCARLVAQRKVNRDEQEKTSDAVTANWGVEAKGVPKDKLEKCSSKELYDEDGELMTMQEAVDQRRDSRTGTDAVFAFSLQTVVPVDDPSDD